VYWLLIPFVFSALAFGGIIVPKINLILGLICREYYADKALRDPNFSYQPGAFDLGTVDPLCNTPEVQARVAEFTMIGGLISGILSAIIAPKLGAMSDRYGRRKIMMITNAGALSGEIITIFAAKFPETFPVYIIFIGNFLDGLAGSFIAAMAISHSYSTDCTPPNRRNVVFGYFHGMMFIGIALGPLIAAEVFRRTQDVIVMFYIALGCHLAFIILLVFFIPESLSKHRQKAAWEAYYKEQENRPPSNGWFSQLRNLNVLEPLKILFPTGSEVSLEVRRNLLLLASVDGIIFGVGTGAMTAIVLYSRYHFTWDVAEQSVFTAVVNSTRVLCLLVVLPFVTRLFRGKVSSRNGRPPPRTGVDLFEMSVIRLAIFFDILGFVGYTFADTSALFMTSGAVASMGGIGSPTLQAALTKHVHPGQVGQLLGAMGLIHAIARIISPILFSTLYAYTVGKFDQAVFVVLTIMFGGAWFVSWMVKPGGKLHLATDTFTSCRLPQHSPT